MAAHRRKLQFSLRGLLVFGGVIGSLLGGLGALIKATNAQRQAIAMIEKRGGTAGYDYEFEESGDWSNEPASRWPRWMLKVAGRDVFHRVIYVDLNDTATADADLACLHGLPHLQVLVLGLTEVSDQGFAIIGQLSELQELYLLGDNVSGLGVRQLARQPHLRILDLRETHIGQDDLKHLANCKTLRLLKLTATNVTNESVMKLQAALPECQIVR